MEEEGTNTLRLIVGVVVVVLVIIIGFFIFQGISSKKQVPSDSVPSGEVTPTSYLSPTPFPVMSLTPTPVYRNSTSGFTGTTYYYNNSSSSQSQSQSLPNGTTQSQSQ